MRGKLDGGNGRVVLTLSFGGSQKHSKQRFETVWLQGFAVNLRAVAKNNE
jgi:hypothetical protein